jgi:tetratricopeptide (TPR) repeat protein
LGIVLAATLPLAVLLAAPARQAAERPPAEGKVRHAASVDVVGLNNLGVAYLNQGDGRQAEKLFRQALAARPDYSVASLNLGIALLSQQKTVTAREALEKAARKLPQDPYAFYNLGLAYKSLNEVDKAIAAFRRVGQIAPNGPDSFYFVGVLLAEQGKFDEAIGAFRQALRLNTFHASAEFGLARVYQRKGDSDAAREHLKRFQNITENHLGVPMGGAYGDQGRFSVGEYARPTALGAPAPIPVRFTPEPLVPSLTSSMGACFFDFDGDGRPDLFLVAATAAGKSRLLHNAGDGHFDEVTEVAGLNLSGSGWGCAAGDFDNDGKTDLAVCLAEGVRLLHNDGHGKLRDVTEAAGLRPEKGCISLTFVDYDHDGDLDLYIVNAPGQGARNVLWRNNGNGTFTDVSRDSALGVAATGGGVVASDFNNDRAMDFVIAGGENGAAIYLNPREGQFAALPGLDFKEMGLSPAVGVAVLDFDKDGWMDVAFTHSGAPGLSLWRNVEGQRLVRVPLPDLRWRRGWGLTALDYDNDGWVDLAAVGESSSGGELRLLRNVGPAGWADVTKDAKLDSVELHEPRAVVVADVAASGAADLVVTQLEAPPILLRNRGGSQHNWLRIDLQALNDNKSAIGTKVELYAGPLYQKWEVQGASGYLGQNATPILAGLGSAKSAEVVRLLWPTGVPQDEVKLPARQAKTIQELDRRGSSCPILFVWNGRDYQFVADMLGAGVVGHWIGPGERDVADPTEYLKVQGDITRPRNGLLSFLFMEPMEETVYLDQVRLLAIDHPDSLEVYPNERFVSDPPFPEFKVIASQHARLPEGAWDDDGHDVLSLLAKHDRKYVTGFRALPFAGFAKLHGLELDLGAWDAQKPLRLLLDGYTDYFTATSMYAADQAGIKVIPPYVEALDARGRWVRIVQDMGFPAGLERTMVADLTGKVPAGTERIRIVTNLKIYWDAVRIDQTVESRDIRVRELPLAHASLQFIGYPREIRGTPESDTSYSYGSLSRSGPYVRAAGHYTRYGDVRELLRAPDDLFVVFGSGEGLKLDFDPHTLPSLPHGWIRDYFFYADGFEKDLDFYAAHAFTVEPLPYHTMTAYPYAAGKEYPVDAEHVSYELKYNTRARSGKRPQTLRYAFPRERLRRPTGSPSH